MSMPGFTAETSLVETSERYAAAMTRNDASERVQMARGFLDIIFSPCDYCFDNCVRQTKTPSGGRDCLMACNFAGLC